MVDSPLKVVIVGAGIGGFTTAIALRRQGHIVDIYESSSFSREFGAAVHVGPHANGILKHFGVSVRESGATPVQYFTQFFSNGYKAFSQPLAPILSTWQNEWLLAHRVKLHDSLRARATSPEGPGTPATLHLAHRVQDVDPAEGIVYFADGTSVQGDVVIGADGIHSVTRRKVPGANNEVFSSGYSAFRFIVPKKSVYDDPATWKFVEKDGDMVGIFGAGRSVIMYPTSNNELLNAICLHPAAESTSSNGWGSHASMATLLHVYRDFHPDVHALLRKANEETLKVWQLLDMEPISQWTTGKLVLMGDAAHPFLPYQGQGSSMAIEDAACLGIVLEHGLRPAEVVERLRLYQEIRKERADTIQERTRQSGKAGYDIAQKPASETQFKNDARTFGVSLGYNHNHNEIHNSTQKLREWRLSRNPHQTLSTVFDTPLSAQQQDTRSETTFTSVSVTIKSSLTLLKNILPLGQDWTIKAPGTLAYCTWIASQNHNGDKSDTPRLGFYVHGVKQGDEQGESTSTFAPIVFTSCTERSGVPDAPSVIKIQRGHDSCQFTASFDGKQWLTVSLDALNKPSEIKSEVSPPSLQQPPTDGNLLVHRYQPHLLRGSDGSVTIANSTSTPFSHEFSGLQVDNIWQSKEADIKFDRSSEERLQPINHIIGRLAELPTFAVEKAQVATGKGKLEAADAVALCQNVRLWTAENL